MNPRSGHSCNTKNIAHTTFTFNFWSCWCIRIGIGRYFEAWAHITTDWGNTIGRATSFTLAWGKKLAPISGTIRITVLMLSLKFSCLQGHWTPYELMELLQSPPFRQQLDSFTYVSHQNLILPFWFLGMLADHVCKFDSFLFAGSSNWTNWSDSVWNWSKSM